MAKAPITQALRVPKKTVLPDPFNLRGRLQRNSAAVHGLFAIWVSQLLPPGNFEIGTLIDDRPHALTVDIDPTQDILACLAQVAATGWREVADLPPYCIFAAEPDAARRSDLQIAAWVGNRGFWNVVAAPGGPFVSAAATFRPFVTRLRRAARYGRPVGSVPLLAEPDIRTILNRDIETTEAGQLSDVIDCLEENARRQPEGLALIASSGRRTHRALHDDVLRLSSLLQAAGQPGDVVAVGLPRGEATVIALLAIWHAGMVWLPMPETIPPVQKARMAELSGAKLLLAETNPDAALAGLVLLRPSDAPLDVPEVARRIVDPDSPAAIMFTSGTTGLPNGIQHSHRALLNRFHWWIVDYPAAEDEVYAHRTALNFIPSLTEMVSGVLTCRPLVAIEDALARDPQQMVAVLSQERCTRVAMLPSVLRRVLEMERDLSSRLSSLRTIVTAGEPVDADLVRLASVLLPGAEIVNDYGCTETNGVLSMSSRRWGGDTARLPAGRPIRNAVAYVLTRSGQLAPVGIEGELYIGGLGAGTEYLSRPDLNADRFRLVDLAEGTALRRPMRLFKTNDRARLLADGQIEVLGRLDNVVKVRGIRVELEATEAALLSLEGVAEAACAGWTGEGGQAQLAAWLVWKPDAPVLDQAMIRKALAQRLPEAAIPGRIRHVTALPRTPSGKLARSRLHEADAAEVPSAQQKPETQPVAESNKPAVPALLPVVLSTLGRVLERPLAGQDAATEFKLLGLDSLSAVTFVQQLRQETGRDLPVSLVFDTVTPKRLADHLEGRKTAQTGQSRTAGGEEIAVIGLACRMPQAPDLEAFWKLLKEGRSAVTEIPPRRWNWRDHDPQNPAARLHSASRWGAFLDGEDLFDPMFFNISAREAEAMSPEQRLFLETCWQGLADAGYSETALSGRRVAIFAGARPSDYAEVISRSGAEPDALSLLGLDNAILAARAAYYLNLKGPALTIDTACSSSLVAVHEGCKALRSGDAEVALVGGVSLVSTSTQYLSNTRAGMLSPDGRCATFDAGANGFVQGEGCGVAVLKPLAQAQADRDRIYAVVRGSGINQDGRSNGITAPSGAAQRDLLQGIYAAPGLSAAEIGMIEAHGTGTKLGDPIEFEALREVFSAAGAEQGSCALGSVKTNIGHLIAAAGIAGFIKACLSLHHRYIPASLNFRQANEHIDLPQSPFHIPIEGKAWESSSRMAAVSAFGFSGTNCHVVLAENPGPEALLPAQQADATSGGHLFLMSAKTATALKADARQLAEYLERMEAEGNVALPQVAFSLTRRLNDFDYGSAIYASTLPGLLAGLRAVAADSVDDGVIFAGPRHAGLPPEEFERFAQDMCGQLRNGTRQANEGWARAMAGLFANRVETGLSGLYAETGTLPCYLPPHAFDRQRYWAGGLRDDAGAESLPPPSLPAQAPAQTHITRIEPADFADHLVGGRVWLPATALVAGLVDMMPGGGSLALKDLRLLAPVELMGRPLALSVTNRPEGAGEATLEWRNYGGLVAAARKGPVLQKPASGATDLRQLMAALPTQLDAARFYADCEQAGLAYGPAFRGVVHQRHDGTRAVTVISLPPPAVGRPLREQAVLLDAALHGLVSLCPHDGLYVPAVISSLTLYTGALPARLVSVAQRHRSEGGEVVASLRLFDTQGMLLAEAKGIALKRISAPERNETTPAGASSDSCEIAVWTRKLVPSQADTTAPDLTEVGILPGLEVPQSTFAVRLLGSDQTVKHASPTAVVWRPGELAPAELVRDFVVHAQALIRNMDRGGSSAAIRLLILTERAGGHHEALAASARAVHAELPKFNCRIVAGRGDSPLERDDFAFSGVVAEMVDGTAARVRPAWERTDPGARLPAQDRPVCLLTGGLGGVGRKLCEWLIRTENARVALVGRRPLPKADAEWIAALRADGAEVQYYAADAAEAVAARQLVRKLRLRFLRIDRVYHCAGVTADTRIAGKTPAEIEAVMRAKVATIESLDEALGQEPLSNMMLFSSISAVIGTPGQADYAAANAWLDAFAVKRNARADRSGHTLSVNWALMADGGMQPPLPVREALRRNHGMVAMPSETAFVRMHDVAAAGLSQAIIAFGDAEKLDTWFNPAPAQSKRHAA